MFKLLIAPFYYCNSIPIFGALLGGLGTFLLGEKGGSTAANAYNAYEQKKAQSRANQQSLWIANTAYQRQAQDLEAAGLNKILGYSKGSQGAPSPEIKSNITSQTALNSALAYKTLKEGEYTEAKTYSEIEKIQSESELNLATYGLRHVTASMQSAQADKLYGELFVMAQKIKLMQQQTRLVNEQVTGQSVDNAIKGMNRDMKQITWELSKKYNINIELLDRAISVLGTVSVAAWIKSIFGKKATDWQTPKKYPF